MNEYRYPLEFDFLSRTPHRIHCRSKDDPSRSARNLQLAPIALRKASAWNTLRMEKNGPWAISNDTLSNSVLQS